MNPRVVLRAVLSFCFLATHALAAAKPNVLLIITDDQGYGDLSIHGNPHVSTPHIDRLGQQSVRFDRYFVNSFCAPTRAALLTGRWPLRTGVHGVTHNKEAMRSEEVTIAEALKGNGYRTALIGKWHNGEQFPYTPPGQGFELFFGFHNGHWNNYFDADLLRGATFEKTKGYISDVLTDEALKFIEKNREQPFFCYLSFNAPHSPFQVPDNYFNKFKAKGLDDTASAFYGMCENIDDNVGRVLAKLDQLKLTENTIVLFMTDNGGTAGTKLFNAGMRGGKTTVHEGGSRVPLFVRWPAKNWKPYVAKPIVSHIDVFPTLLELCGVKASVGPKIDGVSLRPLLEGKEDSWPERVLFTHNPIDDKNKYPGAVRTQKYRAVREIVGRSGGSGAVGNDESAKPWMLFDMEADPGQETNIAKDKPELVAKLAKQYDDWFADISSEGLRRFPIPVGHAEENPVTLHAPQAYFEGGLSFYSGPGYANDWLSTWTNATGKVWFDIDVVQGGTYAVEIDYLCPKDEAGSRIIVSGGKASVEGMIKGTEVKEVPLQNRAKPSKNAYMNMEWATLKVGTLKLEKGQGKLMIEALSKPGAAVMDFKDLRLKKL